MENNKLLAYILIGVGSLFLLSRLDMDTGWIWVGLVAAAFLWGYTTRKSYGLLVAGSVLAGVAVGILLEESWGWNGAFLVSLGVGFAMIDRIEPKTNRWPLYVGGLLALFGVVVGLSETGVLGSFWFALILIGAGAYLLGQNKKEVGRGASTATPAGYETGTHKTNPAPETFVTPGPQPTETAAATTASTTPAPTPTASTPTASVSPASSRVDIPPATPRADSSVTSPADFRAEAPVETAPAQPVDSALYERLEAWRRETAKREDRAAYLVLTNESLRQVAAEKPQTLDALKAVKGIGPVKLERYGEAILKLIRSG